MIKIAICDDEPIMTSQLADKIETYMKGKNETYKIEIFNEAETLLNKEEEYDLVFLDIQMNKLNGMEAAKKLRAKGNESYIIFVTVLKECVYDAFEVQAADYMTKPIDNERFQRTMDRIIGYIKEKKASSLTIQKGMWCKTIPLADILYCEAINRKVYVHTKYEVIDYYQKIEVLEEQLKPEFFRCHRSYLVNLKYVCGCEKGMATLENSEEIPISRLRQQEFLKAVLGYMKGR